LKHLFTRRKSTARKVVEFVFMCQTCTVKSTEVNELCSENIWSIENETESELKLMKYLGVVYF